MTQGTGYESEPCVSADGARFAYSTGNPGYGAVIVDLEAGRQATIGRMRVDLQAALSPDGSRLAYVSWRWDGCGELAEMPLVDGAPSGPPIRLTNQEGNASHPRYSPDGRWIAYHLIEGERRDIWVVPAGGGQPVRFTADPYIDVHPAWSPDGTMLAFVSRRAGTHDVWVAPVRGGRRVGEPRRVTDGRVGAFAPVWSPDGSEIAFVVSGDVRREVWLVPSDGSESSRQLTSGVDAIRIRWDHMKNVILASATCGEGRRSLWTVCPETGEAVPFETEIVFGTERSPGLFDISTNGRLLVFSRDVLTGDIWVSEGPPGSY